MQHLNLVIATPTDVGDDPGYPNSAAQINRALPITSLDTGLYFDRPMGLLVVAIHKTFEPRAYYLYIPEQNQSNIPIFDTATATYNYNHYLVKIASQVTTGLTWQTI